ncbi:MAG: anhydro-N-acetylmuramic acid kinase, partial [Pseudomonadota bacterium]
QVVALPVRNVAGLMTGTSMDGLDIAICRIRSDPLGFELLAFETVPMQAELRRSLSADALADVGAIARANMALGHYYAEALGDLLARHPIELHLIGSHGQTVYHEHRVTTLQLGEPAPLAARFACPVVHDFRANDIVAGGAGAPLVPYVDYRLLAGHGEALLAVNIGGIANFTALPKDGPIDQVLGMDCGPGNMIMDQLVETFTVGRETFDRDGAMAARGRPLALLEELAQHPFFTQAPPKSAGREQFGPDYVRDLVERVSPRDEQAWCDLLAAAVELTAFGIETAYRRYVAPGSPVDAVVVAGGGARNPTLMARLAERFAPVPVRRSDQHGLPADAKEAIAFAILASERVDGRPTNVPSVTGAKGQVLLGKITEQHASSAGS